MSLSISSESYADFLNCAHKFYLTSTGKVGDACEPVLLDSELQLEYRRSAERHLLSSCVDGMASQSPAAVLDAIHQRYSLILGARASVDDLSVRFDALQLQRVACASLAKRCKYVPILFVHRTKLTKSDRLQLALCAYALSRLVGSEVHWGRIVHGPRFSSKKVLVRNLIPVVEEHLRAKRAHLANTDPPRLRLNRHCALCQFQKQCRTNAIEQDDLSLLGGISEPEIDKMNGKGFFSIRQLSYNFRPRKPSKRARKTSDRRNFALHALALREKTTYVLNRPSLPKTKTSVFVDIEGDPDTTSHYLLGALVREGTEVNYHHYWTDDSRDAPSLFREFVATIEEHDDLTIFHYGAYESRFFSRMLRQQRCSKRIALVIDKSVNVLRELRNGVYFPTFSNGLKDVAKHLGFQWTDKDASGVMSLVWRRRWEITGNQIFKQKLLKYNQEDCRALALVTDALHAIQDGKSSVPTSRGSNEVAPVPDLVSDENRHQFGTPDFYSATFEQVNRCAYFDYQRERILLRTRNKRIPAARRTGKRKKYRPRPNKRKVVRSIKCPKCKSTRLTRINSTSHVRYNLDLRVSRGGTKRWITKYTAAQHQCRDCRKTYVPPALKSKNKYGHALKAWTMYQHVANRISYQNLQTMCRECFGLHVHFTDLFAFKEELARFYQPTYKRLLQILTTGPMLNIDETHINLRKERAYVWVIADFDNVVFLFRQNREGTFLVKMLENFAGVLVSDFYSAYDSLKCEQQKCLVHLIRDINTDIRKNPFDEELKGLADSLGMPLREIVMTIDRYGLKKHFMKRHLCATVDFVDSVERAKFTSKCAVKYQKRISKYRNKLFVFMSHDGVPWNNNNAEHAIKHFARYRREIDGKVTQSGVSNYLVLLSVYQTCKYRGVNCLDFMLSGCRDLFEFCGLHNLPRLPKSER